MKADRRKQSSCLGIWSGILQGGAAYFTQEAKSLLNNVINSVTYISTMSREASVAIGVISLQL
jgi:hypothetical protein